LRLYYASVSCSSLLSQGFEVILCVSFMFFTAFSRF
jgi:hypothetical protein